MLNGRRNKLNRPLTMTSGNNPPTSAAPDARADALLASFERAGYARVMPAILQPAEPFLDLSGEDIRRRMFLTVDAQGRELCLRPDFTIAVSRDYLASGMAGRPAALCYLGPLFRQRDQEPSEFVQAGVESFGRTDTAAADAEILSLGLEAAAQYGVNAPDIRMGDVGLFTALIDNLDLVPAWKRRLIKDFGRAGRLERDLDLLALKSSAMRPEYQGVLAALAGSDPKGAHALVTDLLSIAGITAVGGRSVGEIADRFLEQAALGAHTSLPQETRALIQRFLAIKGDPDEGAAELRAFARDAKLALGPVLDLFESRVGFLAARGVDISRIRFATAFSIDLDYYTGFEFRLHDPAGRIERPLVAGGRYDKLLSRLGSAQAIPAVGLGVWIERLAALRGGS
jgi:ATP phosphoribosyltransferase regulatory subunit